MMTMKDARRKPISMAQETVNYCISIRLDTDKSSLDPIHILVPYFLSLRFLFLGNARFIWYLDLCD